SSASSRLSAIRFPSLSGYHIVMTNSATDSAKCWGLEFRHLSEIEIRDLHRRNHHVERLFSARSYRRSHRFHMRKHMQQTFVEPKIADAVLDLAVLYIKRSVSSHARKNFLVRIDFADIPQPSNQHPTFRRSNHLIHRFRIGGRAENDIHRRLSHLVWEGKTVSS